MGSLRSINYYLKEILITKFIMPLQQFLLELFEASPNYSLPNAVGKLRAYGGISSLLNSLTIDHRQITDIYKHHKIHSFPSANPIKIPERAKKVNKKQPELQNILLYLITLSFFVKMLLFDNDLRQELNIYSEVISFVFLIFIIAEKKSRTHSETIERIPEQVDDQKRFKVRRNGYEHYFLSEQINQGDIVLLEENDCLKFDAIILEIVQNSNQKNDKDSAFITVNEEEVGTGRSKCKKYTVWKVEQGQSHCLDPFLLGNSKIIGGSVWALVCLTSKLNPSKRSSGEVELGGILKLSNLSHQVQHVIRFAVVLLVAYLSLIWISVESMDPYDIFLQLIYLISCLTLYLSYANTSEFLSCLKKYLKQKINGKGYRILNHKLLEKLGEIDLIIIQDDCLTKNIELITKINQLIDLKIVTPLAIKHLESNFGGDLNHDLVFQPTDNKVLRETLNKLARCKFISISYERFRNYYLQILRDLKYCMVYMSRSRAAIGKYDDIITIKCSDMEGGFEERLQGEWIRISQGVIAENVFLDIMQKARIYKRFEESFYTIVINNCFQLLMLIGWALNGCLVDLNLNLLIVFINRNRVKQFYEAISEQCKGAGKSRLKTRGLSFPLEVNLIFLIYYIYMNWEIAHSINREFQLFLLLMTNRMFRIEALLRENYHTGLMYRLLSKSLIIFVLIILEAFLKWELGYNSDFISESLDILLLPLILLLFALFL